uniref:Biotin carboxyl carrier protein of acetyl-CoA carboxylase n=1 Tax=Lympha mucosa TaxID=2045360 RepID=A0A6B9VRS7_9FLOR|nr:Acetyl-CoA carboxylase, biotin carboxyl carrier protein [Lympha mucosa]
MQFNLKDLRGLLLCVKNNNLQYISIKKNGFELMISREIISVNNHKSNFFNYSNINFNEQKRNNHRTKLKFLNKKSLSNTEENNLNQTADNYFTIVSPMVGTFYRSPGPNEPYFIELYDQVEKHQTVCIIEAMKLMNEIEAEISGNIVEILVKDGDIVDCGQALMKIRSSQA